MTNNIALNIVPILFFLVIFYFLIIRPNQKKIEEQEKMVKALKIKDKVITSSGVIGEIIKINEKSIIIKSANSEIEFNKENIIELLK